MKIKDRDGIILIPRYLECRYISKSYASHVLDSANTVALGKIRKKFESRFRRIERADGNTDRCPCVGTDPISIANEIEARVAGPVRLQSTFHQKNA